MSQKFAVMIAYDDDPNVKRYSPDFQTQDEFAKGWQSALKKAHHTSGQKSVITCGCRGKGEKRLYVRALPNGDAFILVKAANTGIEHDPSCVFFSLDARHTGLKGYASGVVRITTEGDMAVRLGIGMTEKDPPEKSEVPPLPHVQRPEGGQASMTLLGLLSLLWTESGLNVWYPKMAGKRNDSLVRYRLLETAKQIRTGRACIGDHLFIGVPDPKQPVAQSQIQRLSSQAMSDKRLMLLSVLPRYDAEKHEKPLKFLPLRNFGGLPLIFFNSEGHWDSVKKRFSSEYAAWKSGAKIVVFALTSPAAVTGRGPSVRAHQIVLMHVSENWIPLDSSYEAVVAEKLDAEHRQYVKPMRYDASISEVFPDFYLLDTKSDKPFPMEVFGMATPAYLARKQLKKDYYNREYGPYGWWHWDATTASETMVLPHFPESRKPLSTGTPA
ncbi:hypothetical protein (plasmid) [Citrobacter freundii]|uniref:DUF1173 family protein n=45 Tax=Enterobacterales TaxID=91347 RepID=A0A3P5KBG3_ECOLX|nr:MULTISPECIES: DUF1173 family protein [Enterobacterales]AZM66804.1 hypothetical protein [Salmonella enterica subsp. enterica serovar Braenderup]AZM67170.1 hypothetical protein [Salmonella enterica subsp. enterica serovar Typhimurium var. 5-]EAA1315206.1 DUF1173 domain-containing protein [Salmonella enterica subsp. enterica serovar Java]EAA7227383.1 DUF1173 family protein [Salmonella enterica subsp. enterica serovar Senftenberg]EAM5576524.1 DUF1173 family protein [Salmonella enterica subsp. e